MTNKSFYRKFLVPLLFATLILFAINFQVTVWFGFLGSFPAPALWPTLFVYLVTNRSERLRYAWTAFVFIMICSYTVAVPLAVFLALLTTSYLVRFTQKRFSAIDTTDLIGFSWIATFVFPLLYAVFASFGSEFIFNFWNHVISSLLTLPFIPVLLWASRKVDRVLNLEDEGILISSV